MALRHVKLLLETGDDTVALSPNDGLLGLTVASGDDETTVWLEEADVTMLRSLLFEFTSDGAL